MNCFSEHLINYAVYHKASGGSSTTIDIFRDEDDVVFLEARVPKSSVIPNGNSDETFEFRIYDNNIHDVVLMNKDIVDFLLQVQEPYRYHFYQNLHKSGGVMIDVPKLQDYV